MCVFHLLREYWRNLGAVGFAEAKRLLRWESLAEGWKWARRLVRLTAGAAAYWRRKALSKGRRRLTTEQIRHRTTSRIERRNRDQASDDIAFGVPQSGTAAGKAR